MYYDEESASKSISLSNSVAMKRECFIKLESSYRAVHYLLEYIPLACTCILPIIPFNYTVLISDMHISDMHITLKSLNSVSYKILK